MISMKNNLFMTRLIVILTIFSAISQDCHASDSNGRSNLHYYAPYTPAVLLGALGIWSAMNQDHPNSKVIEYCSYILTPLATIAAQYYNRQQLPEKDRPHKLWYATSLLVPPLMACAACMVTSNGIIPSDRPILAPIYRSPIPTHLSWRCDTDLKADPFEIYSIATSALKNTAPYTGAAALLTAGVERWNRNNVIVEE